MSLFEVVRDQINLSDVARCFTELKSSGTRLLGCCPLPNHNDSNPSFNVYPDGKWYCFGCREYGDVVDLWAAIKGLQSMEAAFNLAHKYGVELPGHDPDAQKKASDRRQKEADYARQIAVCHQALSSHPGVIEWWQRRGFDEKMRQRFLLGVNREGSAAVIPFWHRGRIQGFIRRQFEREPKYLLPKAEDFPSGYRPLFIPASTQGDLHLVEGYIDALALAAMDMSAIALGGTGISQEQKAEIEEDETINESPVLVLHDPEAWPESVDGASLLNEIAATLARFISAAEAVYRTLALWVLYSHSFNVFDVSPLLAIVSPEKRCGKTTLLTLLGEFVPRPLFTSNITASALFRIIEKYHPTLLIDEADTFLTGDETLRGILNSGHHRNGAYIIRTAGEDYEPRQFTTWAPKAIAMIGNLPGTLDDRAIKIKMQRKASK